jgi:ZIP family zinc transporter
MSVFSPPSLPPADEGTDFSWSSSNVITACLVATGAGLATGIGGLVAFMPSLLKRFSPPLILSVALSLSGGVMIYVSFIEIFAKSYDAILSDDPENEGRAAGLTTLFFFLGMGVCLLLELAVSKLTKKKKDVSSSSTADTTDVELAPKAGDGATKSKELASAAAAPGAEFFASMDGLGHDHGKGGGTVDMSSEEEKEQLGRMGVLTALAIALHNFPEGLATFLATVSDPNLGAALGTAIAIHNVPEGICVAMPIYYATGNKWKAFSWSLLSGITEPIGGILGYAALQPVFTDFVFGLIFSMVGGMMVFIVLHELLPTAHRYMPGRSGVVTGTLVLGMMIMSLSLILFVV